MNAIEELLLLKNDKQAQHLMRFFKTQEGQYGYGDKFLGIRVPDVRNIVKKHYKTASLYELKKMLEHEYHEIRLCALLMMTLLYKKADKKDEILNLYLKSTNFINNWDLVDLSAPKIVGENYLETKDPAIIYQLANSNHLWSERIAIVSQWSVIRNNDYTLTIELAQKFLTHRHDLIHKASGWMLREAGKRDKKVLLEFLDKHHKIMPRTMLRYSIEKLSPEMRKFYMS